MKSLVAVRQTNRDQRPGPRALGGQLVHVRGFSRGWPGQPRLKVPEGLQSRLARPAATKAPPLYIPVQHAHLAIWCHFSSQASQGGVGLLLVPLMHTRCLMKCPKRVKQT